MDSPYFHLKALNPHSVDMMRHFCGDIARVQCFAMKAPGRSMWSTASFNFAVRQRHGRAPDQQLRHRARAPDGALRGGRG